MKPGDNGRVLRDLLDRVARRRELAREAEVLAADLEREEYQAYLSEEGQAVLYHEYLQCMHDIAGTP